MSILDQRIIYDMMVDLVQERKVYREQRVFEADRQPVAICDTADVKNSGRQPVQARDV